MDSVATVRTRGYDVAPCYRVTVESSTVASGTRDEILYTVTGKNILNPNDTIRMSGLVNANAVTTIVYDACVQYEPGLLFYQPDLSPVWRLWLPIHLQNEDCA